MNKTKYKNFTNNKLLNYGNLLISIRIFHFFKSAVSYGTVYCNCGSCELP